jgi:hypothetical protein
VSWQKIHGPPTASNACTCFSGELGKHVPAFIPWERRALLNYGSEFYSADLDSGLGGSRRRSNVVMLRAYNATRPHHTASTKSKASVLPPGLKALAGPCLPFVFTFVLTSSSHLGTGIMLNNPAHSGTLVCCSLRKKCPLPVSERSGQVLSLVRLESASFRALTTGYEVGFLRRADGLLR